MKRTIIITEAMAQNLSDEFQMSQLRFMKNSKKFLADLQVDPVGAQPDAIFKYNGLDRQKLLNAFKKNKVVVPKYHIDDHDPDGTPHTAKMGIKYSVLKDGRLDDRLEATYYELFPDSIVRPKYDHRIEVQEATGCCTVGGSGSFLSGDGESYEYDRPLGGKSAGKKNKTGVGGNPYSEQLTESIEEYNDSLIDTDDFSTLPSFAKQVAFCKQKLGAPIGNGSSRMVFRVDDNKVLKLAKNRKGIAQNEAECENSNDYYMGYMFAKVFEYDQENYTYIVAEEALPPKANDFKQILGVNYNEFCRICLGSSAEYDPRNYGAYKLSQEDYDLLEENEPLREWYDYITNYQPTSVIEIIRKCNLGVAHRNDGDAIIITDSGFNDDVKDLYQKRVNEGRKKVIKNDNGEVVPETCTCGGKVTLQIKGEPVYICKECGKYYGTMPFHSKKKMNEGAWGSNPLQSDGGLDKRDDVVADAFKYIVNHIEKNGKYESDNNYHWLGVVLWTMNRFKGSYFKSTLEKSGLDKAVKDVVKNLSKDEKFIGGWSKETQNEVRKYINDFEKQYNELKEKYAIDGDKYKHVDDEFEGKGLMDTIAEKDILKETVTGEDDYNTSAAVYVYCESNEGLCILAGKRKDGSNAWNPPMGFIHKGEDPADGVIRECEEECGLKLDKSDLKHIGTEKWGDNNIGHNFVVKLPGTIDDYTIGEGDGENGKFQWIPIQYINKLNWAFTTGKRSSEFSKHYLNEAVTGEDADKSAALYVYNKDKDENWYILCARRSNRKGDEEGGKWNPPMGHLHKGESMKDGALRECLEESGIDFSKYKKEIKIRDHHTWGSNCTLQLGDYVSPTVTIDDFEPKKGDEENSKFIWLPLEDIKSKTWAWTCGENAYKFIPGEIDLIQEFDFHKAYKNLLDRRGEVELENGEVVPKYKLIREVVSQVIKEATATGTGGLPGEYTAPVFGDDETFDRTPGDTCGMHDRVGNSNLE